MDKRCQKMWERMNDPEVKKATEKKKKEYAVFDEYKEKFGVKFPFAYIAAFANPFEYARKCIDENEPFKIPKTDGILF